MKMLIANFVCTKFDITKLVLMKFLITKLVIPKYMTEVGGALMSSAKR